MPTPPPLGRFTSAAPVTEDAHVLVIETTLDCPDGEALVATEIVPLVDDDRPTVDELVELARAERELRRAEAHRQYAVVEVELVSEPWFATPWARVGAAAVLGYALGRSRALRVLATFAFGASLVVSVDRALAHTAPAPAGW